MENKNENEDKRLKKQDAEGFFCGDTHTEEAKEEFDKQQKNLDELGLVLYERLGTKYVGSWINSDNVIIFAVLPGTSLEGFCFPKDLKYKVEEHLSLSSSFNLENG